MSSENDQYRISSGIPQIQTYLELRNAGGLSQFSRAAAAKGLSGTVFGVLLTFQGDIVGMGRIVGDGGCFLQIVDIVVRPEHQGRGQGKRIMAALMDYLVHNAPKTAYVSLIADVPANELYRQFGFLETAPGSVAMYFRVP